MYLAVKGGVNEESWEQVLEIHKGKNTLKFLGSATEIEKHQYLIVLLKHFIISLLSDIYASIWLFTLRENAA